MRPYQTLFKELNRQEDLARSQLDHEAARAQFILEISREHPLTAARRRKWWLGGTLATVTAALLCGFLLHLGWDSTSSLESKWIQVGNHQTQLVQFTDGTHIRFAQNSAGRVQQQVTNQGEVTLESGRVALSVPHTRKTDWKVHAGPFTVAVTGTRFEVRWNPVTSDLMVKVFEGSVQVAGPLLDGGHAVTSGRSLSANVSTASVQMRPFNEEKSTAAQNTQPPKQELTVATADTTDEASAASDNSADKLAPEHPRKSGGIQNSMGWLQDAEAGNYPQVRSRIRHLGLPQMLKGAQPSDYLTLANAARQAGDVDTATTVYERLRKVYPGTGASATAALYLGRMAFDQQGKYGVAAKWFNVYLTEQKGGTLRREVLGRLMEAQYQSRSMDAATSTAKEYLKQYPDGPHSGRAKELYRQ